MEHLYVGVDVSKDRSSAHGIDENGTSCFSFFFDMDSTGFASLLRTIHETCPEKSRAVVAMESTAFYHINLHSFLNAQGVEAVVVNPLLISNFSKLSLRKTKTDKKDAETIARFLLIHRSSITQIGTSRDQQDIRDFSRERESLTQQISVMRVEIRRLLQSTFPELERLCNPFTKAMQHFIKQYPSARSVMAARPGTVARRLKQARCSKKLTFSAEEIIEAANESVASVSPAKEFILKGKLETLEHLEQRKKRISKILTEYCEASMISDLDIITSIDGINNTTATTFLAETGGMERFASHRKLIAYAGLDPTVYQSGKYEGKSRISKRGNRHLRRVIWIMTGTAIVHNPTFKTYFQKKKDEGQAPKKAIFATSHKLLRTIHAMLTQRTHFEARCW